MPLHYLHYDVFTAEPLRGNQLAVFLDARGLSTERMQRLAREMNFSESTFILPAERDGTALRVRIFTPRIEMPMAGHPTIGTTFALAHAGAIAPGTSRVVLGLNIGPTPVDLEWDGDRLRFAWMTQANPVFGPPVADRAQVAAVVGLTAADLADDLPIQDVSCGVPFLLVPLRDRAAVDRAVSDAAAFRRLPALSSSRPAMFLFAVVSPDVVAAGDHVAADGSVAAGVQARNVVGAERSARGSARDIVAADDVAAGLQTRDAVVAGDTVTAGLQARNIVARETVYSRMFAPDFGIVEDPATGSASGPLGCYLVQHGVIAGDAARRIVSLQGAAMGRASRIHVAIGGTAGAITEVKVGGEAVLVARGEFLV